VTAEIGVGLTAFGLLFTVLGVLFFFDRGLLAMGNVSWTTNAKLCTTPVQHGFLALCSPTVLTCFLGLCNMRSDRPSNLFRWFAAIISGGGWHNNWTKGYYQILHETEKLEGTHCKQQCLYHCDTPTHCMTSVSPINLIKHTVEHSFVTGLFSMYAGICLFPCWCSTDPCQMGAGGHLC